MEELWKDIPGFEGIYQVSNLGRVKRLKRTIPHNLTGRTQTLKERVLTPYTNKYGYTFVHIAANKLANTLFVHKLVAMTFLGHKPCGHKIVVDHKDNNKI